MNNGVVVPSENWKQVASWAESQNDHVYIFILRSLANQGVVTAHSINAFKGQVINNREFVKNANRDIGTITGQVKLALGISYNEKSEGRADWYSWNTIRKEWTISGYQLESLREAFDVTANPSQVL